VASLSFFMSSASSTIEHSDASKLICGTSVPGTSECT